MIEPISGEQAARVLSKERFIAAHRRALREDLIARLARRTNDLLPFESLMDSLQIYEQVIHPEPQVIPLDHIVGSVGRYKDFTASFLPRTQSLLERWARIERQMEGPTGLPPIDVFKVGDVYFVADGNHRVSVARANGFDTIEAYVTEVPVDPGLQPGDSLDQAIMKAGRARFLAETQLERNVPNLDIYFTRPGGYRKLLEHIAVHRHQIQQRSRGVPVGFEEAALDWYQNSYLPIIAAIRERKLLERFPGRTAADLYIWIWGVLLEMHRLFGESISADEGAALLEFRAPSPLRRAAQDLMNRIGASRARERAPDDDIPDWAMPALEWGDGGRREEPIGD
jgi:hypothetical protein